LKTDWQRHVLASSGYLELGVFDEAAQVLEEIEPEEKTRTEVLGARTALYTTAKKWDMVAAVASHLVKVDPQTAGWWISLAYAVDAPKALRRRKPFYSGRKQYIPKLR
jgi:lipopolysaccharide biosynthesis regulator YciM